jgi:outer membrane protein assembly factor BamB
VNVGYAYDWSELGRTPGHGAWAANSTIDSADASRLGERWGANLHNPSLSSPVVVYRPKIGMVSYVGDLRGDFFAYRVSNGSLLWARNLGTEIVASPVTLGGAIFVETMNPARLYKLNLTTGRTECSMMGEGVFQSSLTAADPPGGDPSVFAAALDSGGRPGPVYSVRASDCAVQWAFTGYRSTTGSWAPLSYGVDADGTPLVLVGTSDPDDTEYAIDATTGDLVWMFVAPTGGDFDLAAGATISPPGTNGFAGGVAYVPSKYGVLYALDLTTGGELWSYTFDTPRGPTATETGRSTAALDGTNLVFGHLGGVDDLNAVTGRLLWSYDDPSATEVISSVALAGPPGHEVVLCADLSGALHALSLATGDDLFDFETGGYVVSSPAVTGGDVLVSSSDGFLDDLSVGGGNDPSPPSATITSPGLDSVLPDRGRTVTVEGYATSPRGVSSVSVAIQLGGGAGPYWDAARASWSAAPVDNPASLAKPASEKTRFADSFPVPAYGGAYTVTATAHSASGEAGFAASTVSFTVAAQRNGPRLFLTSPYLTRGHAVSVSGAGFTPGKPVTLSLFGKSLRTVVPGRRGGFAPSRLAVPPGPVFGPTVLIASEGGAARAALPVTVADSWLDSGGGLGHAGFAASDTSFRALPFIGSNSGIDPAWRLAAGHAVSTAPVVGHDVAYVATAFGEIVASRIETGAIWWTRRVPDHSAISGSPALDPAARRIVVPSAGGHLYELATTGRTIWSVDVGGSVGSPLITSHGLVVVTSSAGTVTAVSEQTGRLVWRRTLGSEPSTALAESAGRVYVGEADGTVAAFALGRGSLIWTIALGGSVTAPAQSGRHLYVATSDGDVVSLDPSTGAELWSYSTGAPITTDPVAFLGEVYVATTKGELIGLNEGGGRSLFSFALGCTPSGLGGVTNALFSTCTNGLVQAFRPSGEVVWQYSAGSAVTGGPAIADGTLLVGDAAGELWAFTPYGDQPS